MEIISSTDICCFLSPGLVKVIEKLFKIGSFKRTNFSFTFITTLRPEFSGSNWNVYISNWLWVKCLLSPCCPIMNQLELWDNNEFCLIDVLTVDNKRLIKIMWMRNYRIWPGISMQIVCLIILGVILAHSSLKTEIKWNRKIKWHQKFILDCKLAWDKTPVINPLTIIGNLGKGIEMCGDFLVYWAPVKNLGIRDWPRPETKTRWHIWPKEGLL